MSGTGEDPLPGFPAIGQYEIVPEPGEPGYEEPEIDLTEVEVEEWGDDDDPIDPDDEDPFSEDDSEDSE